MPKPIQGFVDAHKNDFDRNGGRIINCRTGNGELHLSMCKRLNAAALPQLDRSTADLFVGCLPDYASVALGSVTGFPDQDWGSPPARRLTDWQLPMVDGVPLGWQTVGL